LRLYFDTSVLGAVTDLEDRRRLQATRALLRATASGIHEGVISNVVEEEIRRAPPPVRQAILDALADIEFELAVEDDESRDLFAAYAALRIVPARYRNDLRHVAVAVAAGVDALVSWNFRHIVNLRTRRAVSALHLRLGYPLVDIVSPEEV
jgi:predicted nucleic acid-binding protein